MTSGQPPGATHTLDTWIFTDAPSLQAGHASGRIKARYTAEAGINHNINALNGEAGFGDVGGQYNFSFSRVWINGALLLPQR